MAFASRRAGFADPGRAAVPVAVALCAAALAALAGLGATIGLDLQRVAILAVVVPFAEEAVFRAGLQEALLRAGASSWLANVATAVAFTIAHLASHGGFESFAVLVPALLIGAVYGRTRRLRHCVALHAAMNTIWLTGVASGSWTAFR